MTHLTRRAFGISVGSCAAALASGRLAAQTNWPTRPINLIMPLQAGSASDAAVRIVAEKMSEQNGYRMTVENVTGAAGLLGAERAARSQPDGYTLAALNNSILTILPNVQKRQIGFDPFNDFVPIAGLATIPTFLGVHKDVPVKTVAELLDLAKAKQGQLNYASGGPGSPQHLATEMFMAMTNSKMTQIPYKGATAAATDLAGGHVQVMFISHTLALPFLDRGDVRLIGFAGSERSKAFPDIPTVAEQGVPGYEYASWIAIFAVKGTPEPIVARLRADAARALAEPSTGERLAKGGLGLWTKDPEGVAKAIREDDDRWKTVVRTANITI